MTSKKKLRLKKIAKFFYIEGRDDQKLNYLPEESGFERAWLIYEQGKINWNYHKFSR